MKKKLKEVLLEKKEKLFNLLLEKNEKYACITPAILGIVQGWSLAMGLMNGEQVYLIIAMFCPFIWSIIILLQYIYFQRAKTT